MRHQYISNIKPGQYCDIVEWCSNGRAKCVLTTYYKSIEDVRDLIEKMNFNGEDKAGSLERIYHGEKVW